jgi:hypothetical protein
MSDALPVVYLARHGETAWSLAATASLSALGYELGASEPVFRLWDDMRHVEA